MPHSINLRIVPGLYGVARLAADASVPDWFNGPGFSALVRSDDELTLICLQDRVPGDIEAEPNWRCLRSLGPIPFNATGILQALIQPISENGIGVFVLCTFDGEHILVPDRDWDRAERLLEEAGHVFVS
ncbi:ACT domain-containing protein [uncultured Agrobacterium sp.]|uniref:ACT domain-containing protein n=1 Tax=uncultured Agrobacterium sp. TaxID=157277 RepID=UPI00260000AD|nr:ACT domain-containing protein [uncultured Agrobacterium sp.]